MRAAFARTLVIAFATTLVVPFAGVPLQAQAPRIRTELDTALVSVGDRMNFTVRVEHDPAAVVVWPDSFDLGSVEVLEAELLPPANEGERTVTSARFVLAAFELGDLEIPSVDILLETPDGSSTVLSTNPYLITVQSVGLDEGGDIRDIRGPLGIPLSVIYVLPWILLVMLLGGLASWLWTRRKPVEVSPRRSVVIPRFPHEDAYDALDRLEASGLVERGEIKEYHILASEIIRTYVEGRFGVDALELTTGEVVEGLRSEGLADEAIRTFSRFADHCDLVKFAKLRPGPDACKGILEAARAFVDQTKPRVDHFDEGPGPGVEDDSGDEDFPGGGAPDATATAVLDAPAEVATAAPVGAATDPAVGTAHETAHPEDDDALASAPGPAHADGA